MAAVAPHFAGAIVSILAGWLAGGAANLAADLLPLPERTMPGGRRAALHYLTLGWYFTHAGVCPHCRLPRSRRAPALEAAAIAVFVLARVLWPGSGARLLVIWLYAAVLLAVLVIDLEHRRVLNVMMAPAAAAALVFSLAPGGPGLLPALLGGGVGLGAFLLLAIIGRGAMGAGDVKLAGVIGLMLGFPRVVPALGLGIVLGGLGAVLLLVTRRATRKSFMAYAPYLALGALAMLLAGG